MPAWKPLVLACTLILPLAGGCALFGHPREAEAAYGREMARATADLAGPGGITGKATLIEFENASGRAVRVIVHITGDPQVLTPGRHGIHLHAVGQCEQPFASAGGHYDPGPAGNPDPDANHPFHMGDLPNLIVDAHGVGDLDAVTSRVTLTEGPVTVFDADGTAIIVHKNADQGTTAPSKSGLSGGPRLACGVIMK